MTKTMKMTMTMTMTTTTTTTTTTTMTTTTMIVIVDDSQIINRQALQGQIDDDDDDPYGVGIGSVLYWPAWFKRQALANWLRATERFAAPTVDISYEGSFDQKKQTELLTAARSLGTDGAIAHPSNVVVELLEAAAGGGGTFLEGLNRYLDELMSEAVLGETLSTNSGERGARSLGSDRGGNPRRRRRGWVEALYLRVRR